MSEHPYDSQCDCPSCFAVFVAEAEVEKALARERGAQRRERRDALWAEFLAHFGGVANGDTP